MRENQIIIICCIFFCCYLHLKNTNSQIPIHSIISDVNSNTPLENVKIQIKNSKEFYTSNSEGYFYLKINPTKDTQGLNNIRSSNQKSDSILFSKENYHSRKLAITDYRFNNKRGVKLLKKKYGNLNYFEELLDENAFEMLGNLPSKTHLSGIRSVKATFDIRKNILYYINSKKYNLHYTFSKEQLEYTHTHDQFINEQYTNNYKRYLYPITINYFKELDIYTFEFFSTDGATCEDVYKVYQKIIKSSYLIDKLYFYTTNNIWKDCTDIPIIGANELYEGQNYQALNIAENYGYLKKIDVNDIASIEHQKRDIVLTNGIPIDIPVLSGIITTEFQTPLSHINVLSHNRDTPNMVLKNGFSDESLDNLNGELVHLNVTVDSYNIRKATIDEATIFWNNNEPKDKVILNKDTNEYGLIQLENASIDDVNKIGGKAANFAEILKAFKRENQTAPVPENYFAIPFYYYNEHLKKFGIDIYIETILNQSEFKTNINYRKLMLEKIRDTIKNSPLNDNLLANVLNKMNSDTRFTSYRFRSSTNAEDLNGFNGAGLYSSYSGKLNHVKKKPQKAIKKVWASLWNFNAFEERDYFKINHLSTAMGVLVHRSFPDEDANGVVITKNIFNRNHAYVVNVQFKEISVVNPDSGIINDQIIIYNFSTNNKKYTLEYNTFSNAVSDTSENVMTDEELFELAGYLSIINIYFYSRVYDCNCDYKDFGLDIEFKVDSSVDHRRIYIKQARPY